MDLEELIKQVFRSQPVRAYAEDYVTEVKTNWREAEKSLTRSLFLITLTALLFELLLRRGVGEVSLGFVTVTKVDVIERAIPVAIAYLYSVTALLAAELSMFETVYRHLIRYLWPSLYNSNLERVLYPPNSFLYSGDRFYFTYPQSSRARGLVEVLRFCGCCSYY